MPAVLLPLVSAVFSVSSGLPCAPFTYFQFEILFYNSVAVCSHVPIIHPSSFVCLQMRLSVTLTFFLF